MTVEELLDRITAREIAEWAAYFRIRSWEQEQGRSASGYSRDTPRFETLGGNKWPDASPT